MSPSPQTYDFVHNPQAIQNICFGKWSQTLLSPFRKTLKEIVQKDSPGKTFEFTDSVLQISALDLDDIEAECGGEKSSTMDCLVGIGSYNPYKGDLTNVRYMLIELKLNSKKDHLDKKSLTSKVNHSSELLKDKPLEQIKVFIYPERMFQLAKRHFSSWQRGDKSNYYKLWKCMTPAMYNEFILFKENIPLIPLYGDDEIHSSFSDAFNNISTDEFINVLEYWVTKAVEFRNQYQIFQEQNILGILKGIFQNFIDTAIDSEDKEFLKLEYSYLLK